MLFIGYSLCLTYIIVHFLLAVGSMYIMQYVFNISG